MGCFTFGVGNQEDENMLGLCQERNLGIMNSCYGKRLEHIITYKSGGKESQIDYVLCRRHEELRLKNFKVIPGETCLTPYRLLWAEVVIKGRKKRVWNRGDKKIKSCKLKDLIKRRVFKERMCDRIEGVNVDHVGFSNAMLSSTREVYGETTGRRQRNMVVERGSAANSRKRN